MISDIVLQLVDHYGYLFFLSLLPRPIRRPGSK